jgi:Fur family ferric uptake transcriptional regulator
MSAPLRPGRATEDAALAALLVRNGLTPSRQRVAIARVFFARTDHITVRDLSSALANDDATKGIGLATLYRFLNALEGAGLARSFSIDGQRAVFEPVRDQGGHHDHLVCSRCGTVVEFYEPRLEALQEQLAERMGFTVTSHEHVIFGSCEACRAKGEGAAKGASS